MKVGWMRASPKAPDGLCHLETNARLPCPRFLVRLHSPPERGRPTQAASSICPCPSPRPLTVGPRTHSQPSAVLASGARHYSGPQSLSSGSTQPPRTDTKPINHSFCWCIKCPDMIRAGQGRVLREHRQGAPHPQMHYDPGRPPAGGEP